MKKAILFFILMSITLTSFTQRASTMKSLTKQEYLELSKSQKQQAWLLMSGGILLTTAGILLTNHSTQSSDLNDLSSSLGEALGGVLLIGGGIAGLIKSATLFSKSGKNKHNAASLGFNTLPVVAPAYNTVTAVLQPTVTLRINL